MPIPREYATSNPVVRDRLSGMAFQVGTRIGDFVAPEYLIDAEAVDSVTTATHNLDLDDLRAADAEAKEVRFGQGASESLTVVERARKTKMDSRKIEDAGKNGVQLIADRAATLREDHIDAQEYRVGALVTAAANFSAGHKDVTGLNFRTLDLQAYADTWRAAIADDGGFEPEFAEIGDLALRYAKQNSAFREFAGGSDAGASAADLSLANLAEFMGLREIRRGKYSRKIGNDTTATQFWPTNSFLMFAKNDTITTNTFATTLVVPYGQYQRAAGAPTLDVRTENLPGTERLTEVGVYKRYRTLIRNANLGFLVTGIVGT